MPSPRERLERLSLLDTSLGAQNSSSNPPHGKQGKQHSTALKDYLSHSSLSAAVCAAVSDLVANPLLPENPYAAIIPALRLSEIKGFIFADPATEEQWPKNLQQGTSYGLFNVHSRHCSRRDPRKQSPPDPLTQVVSLDLRPNHDGAVHGLSHIITSLDAAGAVSVCKTSAVLDKALYPDGPRLEGTSVAKDKAGYKETLAVSVLPPTTFHGSAFGSGDLSHLVQNVDITVTGPQFEKAVNLFSRRIMTELFAASNLRPDTAAVRVTTTSQSRKKGEDDAVKTWSAGSVRIGKKAFSSAVKSSTVAQRSVTLHLLLRTCFSSSSSLRSPHVEPETVEMDGGVRWKFVRVKRSYVLHYVDGGTGGRR